MLGRETGQAVNTQEIGMIIQQAGASQAGQIARHVSEDLPKVTADTAKPVPAAAQEPSVLQLQNAVGAINRAMQLSNHNLEFSIDPGTKKPVVQVVDTETGDVIRQIPSKEALAIAISIDEFVQRGLLLKQKA
jgi:flagellar protein FlaG